MLFIVPLPLYCLSPPLFPNRTLLLRTALIPLGIFSERKLRNNERSSPHYHLSLFYLTINILFHQCQKVHASMFEG